MYNTEYVDKSCYRRPLTRKDINDFERFKRDVKIIHESRVKSDWSIYEGYEKWTSYRAMLGERLPILPFICMVDEEKAKIDYHCLFDKWGYMANNRDGSDLKIGIINKEYEIKFYNSHLKNGDKAYYTLSWHNDEVEPRWSEEYEDKGLIVSYDSFLGKLTREKLPTGLDIFGLNPKYDYWTVVKMIEQDDPIIYDLAREMMFINIVLKYARKFEEAGAILWNNLTKSETIRLKEKLFGKDIILHSESSTHIYILNPETCTGDINDNHSSILPITSSITLSIYNKPLFSYDYKTDYGLLSLVLDQLKDYFTINRRPPDIKLSICSPYSSTPAKPIQVGKFSQQVRDE